MSVFRSLAQSLILKLFPQEDKWFDIAGELAQSAETVLQKYGIVVMGLDMRRVDDWQRGFVELGHVVTVDGQYGPQLAAAFKNFQGANELPPTGLPDGKTIAVFATSLKNAGVQVYCPF